MAKDPICGMEVDEATGLSLEYEGRKYYFCHPHCRDEFLKRKGASKSPAAAAASDGVDEASQHGKMTLDIAGMHCASCAMNLEGSLKKVEGVSKAAVNFATEKAYVEYDTSKVAMSDLERAVTKAGFSVVKGAGGKAEAASQEKTTLDIAGMHCASCAMNLEGSL